MRELRAAPHEALRARDSPTREACFQAKEAGSGAPKLGRPTGARRRHRGREAEVPPVLGPGVRLRAAHAGSSSGAPQPLDVTESTRAHNYFLS